MPGMHAVLLTGVDQLSRERRHKCVVHDAPGNALPHIRQPLPIVWEVHKPRGQVDSAIIPQLHLTGNRRMSIGDIHIHMQQVPLGALIAFASCLSLTHINAPGRGQKDGHPPIDS